MQRTVRVSRGVMNHARTGRVVEQVNNPTAVASSPVQEDWYWGRLATGGEEDYYWRRLSDQWFMKDVIPSTYLELHNRCFEAYNSHPIARAIIEITTSFVLGKGVKVSASDPKVQQVINTFWYHPDNHMDSRIYDMCRELSLYGEQFIRFFVKTKTDGLVRIRQVDPSIIDQIETDPDDVETPLRFHRRPIGPSATLPGDPPILIPDQNSGPEGTWFTANTEMMQFCINKVSNAKRGVSDLAVLLPWLRRYRDWLTDRVRLNKYRLALLWDVTLAGADKKTLDRKREEYFYPPEPGSVIFHNESEKWQALDAKIDGNDASPDGRAIKLMIAVGCVLPEHYLSDGDYGNRATASEMSLPTLLRLLQRQKVMNYMLRVIVDRVITEAIAAGTLPEDIDRQYNIIFPEIDTADHGVLASATNTMVSALETAKKNGWISDETAMRLFFQFAGEEVDLHDEKMRIEGKEGTWQTRPVVAARPALPLH